MICRNCQTEFEGKFCPVCGTPAKNIEEVLNEEYQKHSADSFKKQKTRQRKETSYYQRQSPKETDPIPGVYEFNTQSTRSSYSSTPFYKKPAIYILFAVAVLLAALVIILGTPCSKAKKTSHVYAEEYNDVWPEYGLGAEVPRPDSDSIYIINNSESFFSCAIGNCDESVFKNYVSICRENGFTENFTSITESYFADNKEGYHLSIVLFPDEKEMHIHFAAPENKETEATKESVKPEETQKDTVQTEISSSEDDSSVSSDTTVKTEKGYTDSYLDIEYKISGNEAVITGFSGSGNTANISSEYDNCKVTAIADSAFKDCAELEDVLLWADIETLGDYAFANCKKLKSISIPSQTTFIGAHAFENCESLESLLIWGDPDIGEYAFANCKKLDSLNIGSKTDTIGAHAFENCTGLESILFWGGREIGEYAFSGCTKIKELSIPSETEIIRAHAFNGCTALEDILIWSDSINIDDSAFSNCPNLKEKP